ncbi:membrane-bound serine protease (ClpP class) [Amphibacillus marinus]|uniref:Membrane-bound serine protease (ClpP class) n=1 Tax=Amphibacillus marinus TaxID=872970 RepID=A0A1H8NRK6_9BACI|nr:nodulation protein NfeD [Amphibacillus marinus]SEO32003.1 membrane-bound serine protease (ClpP class) [Amphibacillus marinus]
MDRSLGKKILIGLLLSVFILTLNNFNVVRADGEGKLVHVIPIEKEVERGLEAFLRRTITEAVEENVDHIILEINTPGGRVDAASNIGGILQSVDIPMTAYIRSQALSAGSYIALFADYIYMSPQATIGASGIITGDGNAADEKAQSYWLEAMGSAAEAKGRDRLYAEAMADPDIDLPEYNAPVGRYLTLGPTSAIEVGYSEGTVSHRTELLVELGLSEAEVVEIEVTVAEEIARFLTNAVVVSILLSLAGLGFIVELYSPGFGVAGSIGAVSLLAFFYGHAIAGLAGYEVLVLIIVGIALIVAEFFVPGGILGAIGAISIVASLFMASTSIRQMSISILIALVVSIAAAIFLYKRIGLEKGIFKYIILNDAETPDRGYVSAVNRHELLDQEGVTVTPLRPSGTAVFNHERLDVVSEGGFISSGQSIKVVKVAGSRIVVRAVEKEEEL